MTKYSSLLKGKLQELLTARGLPIDGTKEVLIERLEESDKIAAELEADDEPEAAPEESKEKVEEHVAEEPVAEEQKTEDVKTETEVPTKNEAETAPAAPSAPSAPAADEKPAVAEAAAVPEPPTPETLKASAVELLNRKIARAQKFGEDDQVALLKANLARVEKFGVELDSALARELGFAPPKSSKPASRVNNHSNHHNRYQKKKNFNRRGSYGNGHSRQHVQQGRVYKTR